MASKKNGKRKGGVPREHDPRISVFAMELILSHNNASEAARNMGEDPSWGRGIVAEYPELRELATQAIARFAADTITEWSDMHAKARRRILQNLDSLDDRVSQRAAEYVIERLEGKVPQRVDVGTPKVDMNSVYWRFVTSLHVYKGWTVAEAIAFAEKNPDEVEAWGQLRGLLPGRDVTEA